MAPRVREARLRAISDADATRIDHWEPDLPNEGVCEQGRFDVGFGALRRTIAAARAAGSEYVLLNIPEHASRSRGPEGLRRYTHYLEQLRAFAAAEGVAFVDPTGGDPFRFEGTPYADFAHMTEAGVRQFTRSVALQMGAVLARIGPGRRSPAVELTGGQRPAS